jgi:pantetheine-phosphate adenylyltransferase
MKKVFLYSGSFDPMTLGHLDVLRQSLDLADETIIAIGRQAQKRALFGFEERRQMIEEVVRVELTADQQRVRIIDFDGLVVDAARDHGAGVILRGLRNGGDLEYEMQMAGMNAAMAPEIRTVYVGAGPGVGHVTATLVRQIAAMGGDIRPFVPDVVARRLMAKFA